MSAQLTQGKDPSQFDLMKTCQVQVSHRLRRRMSGFSLIELMIVVVVVAVLAGVAFPSFMDAVRKSRRSEAFTALNAVQQAQERFRGNNATYASDLTGVAPAGLGLSSSTPGTYYTISLATDTSTISTTYEAIATASSGSSQAKDGSCAKLGVRMSGGNLTYAGAAASGTLTYAASSPCWSR